MWQQKAQPTRLTHVPDTPITPHAYGTGQFEHKACRCRTDASRKHELPHPAWLHHDRATCNSTCTCTVRTPFPASCLLPALNPVLPLRR